MLKPLQVLRMIWCAHLDIKREHIDGVWYFVCACGYRTPVLHR